jgi:hypothetical protein
LRRGRKDRGSGSNDDEVPPVHQSPNEPRSISKLPKPTEKDRLPDNSVKKDLPPRLEEGEGSFRDYNEEEGHKIPLYNKNTDFLST